MPSFLPLGTQRLYEFQRGLFEGEDVVLALPRNFEIYPQDARKLARLDVRILQVPEELKLGEMVVYCINVLDVDENLTILHGDTYFQKFDIVPDSVQVAKVRENYHWSFLDEGFCLRSDCNKEGKILAGGFCFSRPRILLKNIVQNDYSFVDGIKGYSKEFPLEVLENETWLDFGLIANYFRSKQAISTERFFNTLRFEKGFCVKSSKMQSKCQAEAAWFEGLPEELMLFVPRFCKDERGYKSEYLFCNNLAELFVFGNLPSFVWKKIFENLKDFLQILHSFEGGCGLDFDHKNKSLSRLKEVPQSLLKTQFNGLDAFDLIERLDIHLKAPSRFSLIHGDLCFSNAMYDFRAGRVRVYDPRGMDFAGQISPFGDRNYDLAKLTHSVFGLYDLIVCDFYDFSQEGELVFHNDLSAIQEAFLEVFPIDENVKAITIHLFLSMLPLHSDSLNRQRAFLANAFRLYELFFGDRK